MQNRLFVANKPPFISSNRFLSHIKREFGVKKAGFSGTLDPFATGVLIVAFGQYTKLFQFLKKSPKRYIATLWLGAISDSFDIENIKEIKDIDRIDLKSINTVLKSLKTEIEYLPPKYSAKKIDGKRAYNLARDDIEFKLKAIKSTIYDIKLLSYMHPFITFDITISEGGYIRSIAQIVADKLGVNGTLSSLKRVSEGEFVYDDKKSLDPLPYLDLKENFYLLDKSDILLGKKLKKENFRYQEDGNYFIICDKMLSVITINGLEVKYRLNGVKLC